HVVPNGWRSFIATFNHPENGVASLFVKPSPCALIPYPGLSGQDPIGRSSYSRALNARTKKYKGYW
ncbi:MAG TPA: hypothetical protein VHK27_01095, partial [Gammaproteobacteria bacterium]|nr:hypothetical protein [Gammaproteobacteria bacterium]